MFVGELHKHIYKLAGLTGSGLNLQTEVLDNPHTAIRHHRVISYWKAEIRGFQETIAWDEVVIGVFNTLEWSKAVILTQTLEGNQPPKDDFYHAVFEPWGWDDPVIPALQSVNLFPITTSQKYSRFRYAIEFWTTVCSGYFHAEANKDIDNPNYTNVWNALLSSVVYFAELSDNENILKYIRYEKFKP